MTTTSTVTATAQAIAAVAHIFAEEAPAMTATAHRPSTPVAGSHRVGSTVDALLVYRPLDEAWGDADALAQLRSLRAERTALHESQLAMVEAADAHERSRRRAERQDRASRRRHGRRGFWGLLPA